MVLTILLVGFEHTSFAFAQEANMHENRFNEYRIPSGMLIVFLEKALTLIHMETHLDDVSTSLCQIYAERVENGVTLALPCCYRVDFHNQIVAYEEIGS